MSCYLASFEATSAMLSSSSILLDIHLLPFDEKLRTVLLWLTKKKNWIRTLMSQVNTWAQDCTAEVVFTPTVTSWQADSCNQFYWFLIWWLSLYRGLKTRWTYGLLFKQNNKAIDVTFVPYNNIRCKWNKKITVSFLLFGFWAAILLLLG